MAEVEFAGVKFKGGKIFVILTALTTLIGGLYGGFEVYKDYMDMREKIESYTAPDLSGIHEDVEVLKTLTDGHVEIIATYGDKLDFLSENVIANENADRDNIKMIKDDVRRIETIVEAVEDRVKADARENEKTLEEEIQKLEKDMDELQEEVDEKIEKALANPLANINK